MLPDAPVSRVFCAFRRAWIGVLLLSLLAGGLTAGERPRGRGADDKPQPGLIGWYAEGKEFNDKAIVLERIDATINFAWGGNEPAPAVPGEYFCARWVGTLKVTEAGHYTLATVTDDGVRLTIDGKQLTEQWIDQGDTRVAGEIDLTAGDHTLQLDFFQGAGGSTCKLFWARKDGFAETIIPASALSHRPKDLKHPPKRAPQPEDLHPPYPDGFDLAEWTVTQSADQKGREHMSLEWRKSPRREDRGTVGLRYVMKTAVSRYHVLKKKSSPDGSDAQPLITTVGLQQTDQHSTGFRLAYCWDARNFVALGMYGRYQSAVWIVHEGRRIYDSGISNGILDTYYRPAYLRLVLLTDSILVQVSNQRHFNYRTIAVVHTRRQGMSGAPTTVMGFGTIPWEKDYGAPFLANDWPNNDMNEEATDILYFDQRSGMNIHAGRLPELGELGDWQDAENQLRLKTQPKQWKLAILGSDGRNFLAPQGIEQEPQLTQETAAKHNLPFTALDLKENSEPFDFALRGLFKGRDVRKTAALVETTIPHGEDPFVRVMFGVMQQATVTVGTDELTARLTPNYYQSFADRFALIGRADEKNNGVLRFKIWNNDHDLRMWAKVEPNFPGARIGELLALIKAFATEPDRTQRVRAHLEIGTLAMQFYDYTLARSHFAKALGEATGGPADQPHRQDLVDHAVLLLIDLAETLGDTGHMNAAAEQARNLCPDPVIQQRAWSCAANAQLYAQGPVAAGAWLDKTAAAQTDPQLRRELHRMAARGYIEAGLNTAAAREFEQAAKALADEHSLELQLTGLQYRLNDSLEKASTPDVAVQPLLNDLRKLLAAEVAATKLEPNQPAWSKYWQDRAAELEPKQPGRAWSALMAALVEQVLWQRATDDQRATLFTGGLLDYTALADVPGDKYPTDRNKLWETVGRPDMILEKWEIHPAEPLVLDSFAQVFEGEKGGGPWKEYKMPWFSMVQVDRNEPEGVYHARSSFTIPAKPAADLRVWLSLNCPGKIWIDGKLVFEQTRFVKSQFDMASLPASDFIPGEHKVLIKLIHANRNQRCRAAVRLSAHTAFRLLLQHYEAQAVWANYRDLNTLQERLQDPTGGWSEFLPYDALALLMVVRGQLAGGSIDYAIDRTLSSADAAMKAREPHGAEQMLDDVAWRLALMPNLYHRNDSIYNLLERWRNLALDQYNLALLGRARRFGETHDPRGRAGAYAEALRAETLALLGNMSQAEESLTALRTEYADCDNALASAGLLATRLGHRERSQRDFLTADEATADIEDAQRMIEQEEYKRALARLLKAVAENGNRLYRVEGGRGSPDGRLVSIRAYVEGLLDRMPKPLWPIYADAYDSRSLNALDQVRRSGDLEQYLDLTRQYPYTRGALQALNIAAGLELDAGRTERAARWYRQLLQALTVRANGGLITFRDDPTAPLIRFKLAWLLQRQGDNAAARALLTTTAESPPPPADLTIQYQGQATPLKKLVADLLAQPPVATIERPQVWRSLRGDSAQHGRVDVALPAKPPVLAWAGQLPWNGDRDSVLANLVPAPFFTGLCAAAVADNKVITAGDAGFIVRRLQDGARLWDRNWEEPLLQLEDQGRTIDFTGVPMHAPDVEDGVVAARVSIAGQGAFEARSLNSGRLLVSSRYVNELKNYHAFGAPLISDGLMIGRFLSMRDSGALAVAAINLKSGRLEWMQPLVTGSAALAFNDTAIPLAIQLPPPTLHDGALILDTGLGAVAAIDARTGTPRWVTHYDRARVAALDDRALLRAQRYMMTPFIGSPCLIGSRVLVRPRDRAELLALDATSGRLLWRLSDDPGWYLIGADDQRLYVYDGSLKAIDPTDGTALWQTDLAVEHLKGRGFLCREGIVLPTVDGLTLFAFDTGRRLRALALPAALTEGHLIPLIEQDRLTGLLQIDQQEIRAWRWTDGAAPAASLETAMVRLWNRDWRHALAGADDDEENETRVTAPALTPAATEPGDGFDRLLQALPTVPTATHGFLRRDPDTNLIHIGSEWAVRQDRLQPPADPQTYALPALPAPLPADTVGGGLTALLRVDGGKARCLQDPNNPNRAYVYAGGRVTALDLSGALPIVCWQRVTTGSLTAFAVNEDRLVCCSYDRIAVYDARNGRSLLLRDLGKSGNWNLRPEWITGAAVGHNQVAIFLSSEVGFRSWYDANQRNRTVEVYDLTTGEWRWRRTLGGSYNHFEQATVRGNRLYAYETPEYHSQTSWFWSFDLATGEALTRSQRPQNRSYLIFDDPANRGYFLAHNGDLIWFDTAKGEVGWTVKQTILDWDNQRPFAVNDESVTLMGHKANGQPFEVSVLDRKTGKQLAAWQNESGFRPEGGTEYYSFAGIPNTRDWKITRHDPADAQKVVFEQVWPEMSNLRTTPFAYVTGDSVVVFLAAYMYNVPSWYEAIVFSRQSGIILHRELFSLTPSLDSSKKPIASVRRYGRNFLLMGEDGVMVVGSLMAANKPHPLDVTEMKPLLAQAATTEPLEANRYRAALTTEIPPISMALRFGGKSAVIDGNLAEWQGFDPWELRAPNDYHAFLNRPLTHPGEHAAGVRTAWDREGLYLAVEVRDPSRQPAPANADYRLGDSVRVTVLGDPLRTAFRQSSTACVDLAVCGAGPGAHLELLVGDADAGIQCASTARPDLGDGGRALEIFIPWAALDLNLNAWREDRLIKLLFNVAVPDADHGQRAQGMLEYGAGVSSAPAGEIEPQRFGEIHLIDLSRERMAQMVEVIDLIPDDPKAWDILNLLEGTMRGAVGLQRRIEMFEIFVTRHPESPVSLRAIPHLGNLYRQQGAADPNAKALAFAAKCKVPGDKLAAYWKSGFHFKLWLNPANPPSQVMIQFATTRGGWCRRGSWGDLFFGWGQRGTIENMLLGPLPEPGKWHDMFIPSASQGLESETISGVAFTTRGGDARFDAAEYIDGAGNSLVYIDDSDDGFVFRNTKIAWDPQNKAAGKQSFHGDTKEFISNLSIEPQKGGDRNFAFPFVSAATSDPSPAQLEAWFQAAHLLGDHPMGWEFFHRVITYLTDKKAKAGLLEAYTRYVTDNPDSPYAAKALLQVHVLGKNQFAIEDKEDYTRVEALMKSAKVTTDVRRAFYSASFPGLSTLDILGPLEGGPTAGADIVFDPEKNLDFKAHLKGRPLKDQPEPAPENPDAPPGEDADPDIEPERRDITWSALDLRNHKDWRRYPDVFNFRSIWPEQDKDYYNRTGFAHFTVTSKTAMPAYLYLGSDRLVTVYVNNKQIVKNISTRAEKDHTVIPLRLAAGDNHVLIKFGNNEQYLSLQVRVADRYGKPIPALKFSTALPVPKPDPKDNK